MNRKKFLAFVGAAIFSPWKSLFASVAPKSPVTGRAFPIVGSRVYPKNLDELPGLVAVSKCDPGVSWLIIRNASKGDPSIYGGLDMERPWLFLTRALFGSGKLEVMCFAENLNTIACEFYKQAGPFPFLDAAYSKRQDDRLAWVDGIWKDGKIIS